MSRSKRRWLFARPAAVQPDRRQDVRVDCGPFASKQLGRKGNPAGGIPGVPPAEVVILGGGVVGMCATDAFQGLGAHVTVIDSDVNTLQRSVQSLSECCHHDFAKRNIEKATAFADVVVGAVLVTGERTPILITREMMRAMKPRSVFIDVSIDQGGCAETRVPTMHDQADIY